MLRVSEIWIYPVKSLGGLRCREAMAFEKGFEHDRRWMLVDEQNRFITQREHPQLALFSVELSDGCLKVLHRKTKSAVEIETIRASSKRLIATIWDDMVETYEVDEEVSRWFSRELGFTCRLVKFPETSQRPADKQFVPENRNVSLADGFPYLLIGQASLDELNKRLSEPVTMQRFRPNLVFTGGEPFTEDTWKKFNMGSVRFEAVKPCARCILTTVHPDTGLRGKEPLQTLSVFRKRDNKIYFGMNLIVLAQGLVREGDEIILHS